MRQKLIALFSLIVVFVGGLSYALSRAATSSFIQSDPAVAPRALGAAVAQLAVEGLATERWLVARAANPALREPFAAGTPEARAEAATKQAGKIAEAAANAPELLGNRPAVVLIVDANGVVLGRDGSKAMRGDDLGKLYPALKTVLDAGTHSSDVWVSRPRNEQLFASFATVRGDDGKTVGAVVFASTINDERLRDVSQKTSGQPLLLGVKGEGGIDVVAKTGASPDAGAKLAKGAAGAAALDAMTSGRARELPEFAADLTAMARPLEGYGDGKQAVLVTVVAPPNTGLAGSLFWPTVGSIVFGLLLVFVAGSMLDAYLARPIGEIEDGLLAIMNGQTARRLEIEHAELGGIVFRINSLLNQLFQVPEDETDEEGRPSRAPDAKGFNDALSVDESMVMSGSSAEEASALFAQGEGEYTQTLFDAYVEAKRTIGDPTEQIRFAEFEARIRGSEEELAQRHGKPVRFKVEVKGKEVILLAVSQP